MAQDPLINTLSLCNRLDFNQEVGGRCHLLPSVANSNGRPSANNWPIFYSTRLCNGFASMVSAWLRMTFRFHILLQIWQLASPKTSGSARAAPMAHNPLIHTLSLCNRLDFNQQAGSRCHLLPSVANSNGRPSANNWPIFYSAWLCNVFASMFSVIWGWRSDSTFYCKYGAICFRALQTE